MARDLLDTGHVIPELFFCLGSFPQLDAGGRTEPDPRGLPAFGCVVGGMHLLEGIAHRETDGRTRIDMLEGEILSEQVRILRVAFDA